MTLSQESQLYLNRSYIGLEQSRANLDLGYFDVAISRAYYAMFYAATALLRSQEIAPRKHSGVQQAFAQVFVKSGLIEAEYSRMLGNAYRLRQDSDYEVLSSPDTTLAQNVLADAEKFVARAAEYLHSLESPK